MAGQIGQDGADLVRELVLWVHKVLQQPWKDFNFCHQNLGQTHNQENILTITPTTVDMYVIHDCLYMYKTNKDKIDKR